MSSERPGPISEWIRVEITPEGYWIRAMPGAQAFPLPEVIAYLLALAIPGVDFQAVKTAYDASDGRRVIISTARHGAATPITSRTPTPTRTPAGAAPAVPPRVAAPAETTIQTEERAGDIYVTIPHGPFSLSDVLSALSQFDASRLDMPLIRAAIGSPRGTARKVSHPAPQPVLRQTARRAGSPAAEGILLACGEDHLRDRLSETLTTRGLTVYAAPTAAAAMDETLKQNPDVLLVTHPLGADDGLAFVKEAHSHARLRRTPVILIPENPTREVVSGAIQAGACDLLVRPVTPGALMKKVGKALEAIGKSLPPQTHPITDVELPATIAAEEELKSAGKVDLVKLAKRVDKLLALPAVVQRVMSITSDARTGARELGLAIQSDPAVTATVLKKANSAYFGKKGQIADIAEAVVRLGFIQTRSLIVGMSMIRLFTKGQRSVGFNRGEFWRHSMATAIIAKLLAERCAYAAPDLAFISGLLHDIGKMLLDEYYSAEYEQAALLALKDLLPMRQAERQVLETDHTEVGAAILELWKFPQPITTAVGRHHDLAAMAAEKDLVQQKLCSLVHAANYLAKAAGEGNAGDQSIAEVPKELWDRLGIWEALPPEFWKTFQNEIDRTQEFLDLGDTKEARPSGEPRRAVVLDESGSAVSLLCVLLTRAGWTLVSANTPELAAKATPENADVLVIRTGTAQRLVEIANALRGAGSALPIVAVLPQGQPAPGRVQGFDCVVEPYDRLAFLQALPS